MHPRRHPKSHHSVGCIVFINGGGPPSHRILRATSGMRPPTPTLAEGSTGSFDPLRIEGDDDDLTLSPVLLSNPGGVRDTIATDVARIPSMDSAGAMVMATTMAGPASDVPLSLAMVNDAIRIAVNDAIKVALQDQTAHLKGSVSMMMEACLEALDTAIRSLHGEVRRNHGHITKRLIKPLKDRVAALKEHTDRLEDGLTAKGNALFAATEELKETTSSLAVTVDLATKDLGSWLLALEDTRKDLGSWLLALEDNHRGLSYATPATHESRDPPTSDYPLIDTVPPTDNTITNSRIAWACVHHQVTLPHAPLSTHHQTPHLRQATLPGAFQPRSSSARVDGDISRKASGCDSVLPAPSCVNTSSSARVDGDISREASGCDSVSTASSRVDTTLPTSPSTPAADSVVLGGQSSLHVIGTRRPKRGHLAPANLMPYTLPAVPTMLVTTVCQLLQRKSFGNAGTHASKPLPTKLWCVTMILSGFIQRFGNCGTTALSTAWALRLTVFSKSLFLCFLA